MTDSTPIGSLWSDVTPPDASNAANVGSLWSDVPEPPPQQQPENTPPTDQWTQRGIQSAHDLGSGYLGPVNAAAAQIGHTATFGMMDRLSALGNAGLQYLRGGSGPGYDDTMRMAEARYAELQSMYPASSIGGQLLGMMLPGKLMSDALAGAAGDAAVGTGLMPRAVRVGLAGIGNGILGAGQGASGYNLSNQERIDQAKSGGIWGAVLGAGTEGLLSGIGAWRARGNTPAPGVDPAARMTQAEQFGLTGKDSGLTKGQSTGNVGQQTFEQKALRGGLGQSAQATAANKATSQAGAIAAAHQSILGESSGYDPKEFGPIAKNAVTNYIETNKGLANQSYASAGAKDASIDSSSVPRLAARVANALEGVGINLSRFTTPSGAPDLNHPALSALPGTQQALNLINKLSSFGPDVPIGSPQSLNEIEPIRQAFNRIKPANAADAGHIAIIKGQFDEWLDDAVSKNLFLGDPTALADFKQGRAYASKYLAITNPSKYLGKVNPISALHDLIQDGIGTDQIATWMTNASSVDNAQYAATMAKGFRAILPGGTSAPEWRALEESVWDKQTGKAADALSQAMKDANPAAIRRTALAFQQSITHITDGPGRALGREVYTPDVLDKMRQFASTIGNLAPSAQSAKSPGFEILRNLADHATLGMVLGATEGAFESSDQSWPERAKTMGERAILGWAGAKALNKVVGRSFNYSVPKSTNVPIKGSLAPAGTAAPTSTRALPYIRQLAPYIAGQEGASWLQPNQKQKSEGGRATDAAASISRKMART
jgi:hypothetical protein